VLKFSVVDDGAGFDAAGVAKGAGLQNMVDRLEALDGSLEVETRLGEGTRVIGALPVEPAAAGAMRT
jgi:signal transduction histidine kinase